MTPPLSPEALRTALVHACFDPGHVIGPRDGRTMDEWRGDACMKQIAPLLAALQQVTAERVTEQVEDERFAVAYTTARGAVDYEHMARVLSGRLRRMDRRSAAANRRADAAEAALATASAEAARLRAEVEHEKALRERAQSQCRDWCKDRDDALERLIIAIEERDALRAEVEGLKAALKPHQAPPLSTALARAATAREG